MEIILIGFFSINDVLTCILNWSSTIETEQKYHNYLIIYSEIVVF